MLFHFMLTPVPGAQCYYHPCFANEEVEAQNLGDLFKVTGVGNCGASNHPSDFYCSVCPPLSWSWGLAWGEVSSSDQLIHAP